MGLCRNKIGSSHALSPGLKCYCWGVMVLFPFWAEWYFLLCFLLISRFIPLLSSACLPPCHTPPMSVHYTDGLCWECGQSTRWVLSLCLHPCTCIPHTEQHSDPKAHMLNFAAQDGTCVWGAFADKMVTWLVTYKRLAALSVILFAHLYLY